MDRVALEKLIKDIDRRTESIEQILPSLATKVELQALSDRTDRRFDELANRIREEGERSRRHMDVLAEAMRDQVRLLAEGHDWLATKIVDHEARLTRLEGRGDGP